MPTVSPPPRKQRPTRPPATPAAAQRRRVARQLGATPRHRRDDRDRRIADRMARRFHPATGAVDLLLLDVRYWQARRCGWDVHEPRWRTVGRDRVTGHPILCDPAEAPLWRWWTALHPKVRQQLVRLSEFRLCRAVPLSGDPPARPAAR